MTHFLKENPGLLIIFALIIGCSAVCTLLGVLMARSGASLRPILWFAGFFSLVLAPQFAGHLVRALHQTKASAPDSADRSKISSHGPESRSSDPKQLFGPDVDPQLIVDARQMMGGAFSSAQLAQFAALPNGDTVLLARFSGNSAAEKAWVDYLRDSGLGGLGGAGDSQRGYAVSRPAGDRAYALHLDDMVGIWTGKDDTAIQNRMQAGGFTVPQHNPLNETIGSAQLEKSNSAKPWGSAWIATAFTLYLFLTVLYFFKGAAWAGSTPAKRGTLPVSVTELASRLESVNSVDAPFRIERGPRPHEFIATWRYADARWVDLARARGLRRTMRICMAVDETKHVVRATDYAASFDWSAGRGGADLEWKSGLGITFFQKEHQRVFGVQLDDSGRFKAELSHGWTFSLEELKSPLIAAVANAGWTWRPVVWQGPAWLRWLTE